MSGVVGPDGIEKERVEPGGGIGIAEGVAIKRRSAGASVKAAPGVLLERRNTGGSIIVARCVCLQCPSSISRVADAGCVAIERLETGGGVGMAASVTGECFRANSRVVIISGARIQCEGADRSVVTAREEITARPKAQRGVELAIADRWTLSKGEARNCEEGDAANQQSTLNFHVYSPVKHGTVEENAKHTTVTDAKKALHRKGKQVCSNGALVLTGVGTFTGKFLSISPVWWCFCRSKLRTRPDASGSCNTRS